MGLKRAFQALFLAGLGILAAFPVLAEEPSPPPTPPLVETRPECTFIAYTRAIMLNVCLDPHGDDSEHEATAWIIEPGYIFLGKAWGIRYSGGLIIDRGKLRVLLRLDNGTDFLGAEGQEPHVVETGDPEEAYTAVIQLRGEDGSIGERIVTIRP